ncbi:adenylosuccinate synthetase-like [Calliopsis andreniformis]|uniref:adenylosuccinate synthetase-like n=1 Tax=Calliopsis andreniformis TaxID=337506 RepID=UPI003FCCE8D3
MNNIIIGKIVDYLPENAEVVVRFQGGNSAGHTIVIDNEVYKLYLLSSAILRTGKISIIGSGIVLDSHALTSEVESLNVKGVDVNYTNLMVSESCPLILNVHKDKEKLFEDLNGNHKIGTTNKGIGPCYEDKVGRTATRLCDLENADELNKRADLFCITITPSEKALTTRWQKRRNIKRNSRDFKKNLFPIKNLCGRYIDHETYPFVSLSSTVASQCTMKDKSLSLTLAVIFNRIKLIIKVSVKCVKEGVLLLEVLLRKKKQQRQKRVLCNKSLVGVTYRKYKKLNFFLYIQLG